MKRGLLTIWADLCDKCLEFLGYGLKGLEARRAANKGISMAFLVLHFMHVPFTIGVLGLVVYLIKGIDKYDLGFVKDIIMPMTLIPALSYICWIVYARISVAPLINWYENHCMEERRKEMQQKQNEEVSATQPKVTAQMPSPARVAPHAKNDVLEARRMSGNGGDADSYTPEEFQKLPAWKRVQLMKEQEKK